MADTTVITCPECTKRFKGKANLAGKKIKCPFCQHPFAVAADTSIKAQDAKDAPAPVPAAAPEKKPISFDDEDGTPGAYGTTAVDIAPRCPNCANLMADEKAFICVFCGYNTLTRTWGKTEKLIEHTVGDYMKHQMGAYITAGLLLFLLLGTMWLDIVFPFVVNPTNWTSMFDAEAIRLYATIQNLFFFWGGGFFIYKRMIENAAPAVKKKEGKD